MPQLSNEDGKMMMMIRRCHEDDDEEMIIWSFVCIAQWRNDTAWDIAERFRERQ